MWYGSILGLHTCTMGQKCCVRYCIADLIHLVFVPELIKQTETESNWTFLKGKCIEEFYTQYMTMWRKLEDINQ